uniref:Uncharacterized protein n=1 Tax=Chenopodium quinoa TaxID=63459 RepID=A0A803MZH2_CHEQI
MFLFFVIHCFISLSARPNCHLLERRGRVAVVVKATRDSSDSSTSLNVVESVQNLWDSLEDRIAVIGLGLTTVIAFWASLNVIAVSAMDFLFCIMNSIEKEAATDVGSSGDAVDVGSARPAADVGSTGPAANVGSAGLAVDVGSLEGKGKKVEKRLKEKPKIKLEETKSRNEGEDLKSHVYGTLHSRMPPSSIVQVIEKCLENQLKAIRAIGFGSMEFLKVTQLPLQLGLWLVHHFDANTCSLNIPDSEPFCITEEHLHQVLGLPMGGIEIDKNNFSRDKRVIQQWKKQFKSNLLSIKIGELKEFLKEHNSAGLMFKRNFVVL